LIGRYFTKNGLLALVVIPFFEMPHIKKKKLKKKEKKNGHRYLLTLVKALGHMLY